MDHRSSLLVECDSLFVQGHYKWAYLGHVILKCNRTEKKVFSLTYLTLPALQLESPTCDK